jgi:hypothetical protein
MGISAVMETEDWDAAANFVSQFGDFAEKHQGSASFEINEEPTVMLEAGATQPMIPRVPVMDPDMQLVSIDTPVFDIAMDPGRFAFEEEG